MLKYTINKVLDLRFEDRKTHIYVNNKLFIMALSLIIELFINLFQTLLKVIITVGFFEPNFSI